MGNCGKKLALALFLLLPLPALAAECSEDQVFLRGDWGEARFSIELADDDAERARGLMHRESLPMSSGMLFVYPKPRFAGFWMKNTLISLDMLFLDATGTVTHIHHEAIPHDETPIIGGNNILAVLEINGGLARQMGIKVGSQMRHPAFEKAKAGWPC